MPERSSLLQGTQLGVETTSGTSVAADKQLLGTSIEPSIKVTTNTFRPYGQKFVTINPLGKEWTEGSISGPLCYADFSYLAASGVAYAAPVQNGATIAYTHTHTPSQSAADTVKTYTVEVGGSVRAHKMAYGLVTSLGYSINREECMVKGTIMGQRLTDAITLTAAPTAIALQPVLPTEVSVYLDTTAGAIGTNKLLRVTNIDFDFSDRFGPVWPVDAAQTSFAAHVDTESNAQLKMTLAADAVGMGLLTTMRAGSKSFIEIEAIGPVIVGAETYIWRHQICGTVSDVSEFKDEEGTYAIEWTFDATYDATLTYAFKFIEVNTLVTL